MQEQPLVCSKVYVPLNAQGMVFRVLARDFARGYNFKNVKVGVSALQYIYQDFFPKEFNSMMLV